MNKAPHLATLLILYVVYLFYVALFPFHDWQIPELPILWLVLFGWFEYIFLFDIVQNLLLFLPFGLLTGSYLSLQKRSKKAILLLSTLASFLVSFSMEIFQTYNPARIPSLLDILLNTISGFLGALLSIYFMRHFDKLINKIQLCVYAPTSTNMWPALGIVSWLAWGAYQLYPFVPTLHPHQICESFLPILLFLKGEIAFSPERFSLYLLEGTMLYFSGKLFLKGTRHLKILIGFVVLILALKIGIMTRFLSIESVLGCLGSIALLTLSQKAMETLAFEKMEVVERH